MNGKDFLTWLDRAAQRSDAAGARARELAELITALGSDARQAVEKERKEQDIANALAGAADKTLEWLADVSDTGTMLIKAYKEEQARAGQATQNFTDWLENRKQASDDEKERIERLTMFLDEPGRDQLRDNVLNQQDGAALENATGTAREKISLSRGAIENLVTEAATIQRRENKTVANHLLEHFATLEAQGDREAQELRALLAGSRIESKILSNDVEMHDILSIIDEKIPGRMKGTKRANLKAAAVKHYSSFFDVPTSVTEAGARLAPIPASGWAQWLSIGAIIGATLVIIGFFLWEERRLLLLSEVAPARGFITFLFTLGTIALFLVITTATVFDSRSDPQEKHERSKTILTMLVGIFGTVLGFYFGVSENGDDTSDFVVRPIDIADETNLDAGTIALQTSVAGGDSPYTYYLQTLDADGKPLPNRSAIIPSPSGALVHTLELADLIKDETPTAITITIQARDANGAITETKETQMKIGKTTGEHGEETARVTAQQATGVTGKRTGESATDSKAEGASDEPAKESK